MRQSRAKGVLIKVVWSKQNGEGNLHKTERNRIDFVGSWSESGVCEFGTGNSDCIA